MMIVDKINAYLSGEGKPLDEALLAETGKLAAWAFARQFGVREERKQTAPYFSSIGKCLRQQAYSLLDFPKAGKEIDSRAKMVFFMGDVTELAVVQLAKIAGCAITHTGLEQKSVEWNGMRGRSDGILDGTYAVSVKSMSSYGFEKFERGIIDEGYRYQSNAEMLALGLGRAVCVALNKDAGVLAELSIALDEEIVSDISGRLLKLKVANVDQLPERPYAPDAKGFYPWQCRYCAYYKTCLPDAELVLKGGSYKLYQPRREEVADGRIRG